MDLELTVKTAEHQRIDASKLWCWRRLFRVPGTASSNQSILKEINPDYSLDGLMLKLKLQYFGHLMWRADSLEKTVTLGKIEGRRRSRWWRTRQVDSITSSMDMSLSELQEVVKSREAWGASVPGATGSPTQLSGWTATIECLVSLASQWDWAVIGFIFSELCSVCLFCKCVYFIQVNKFTCIMLLVIFLIEIYSLSSVFPSCTA